MAKADPTDMSSVDFNNLTRRGLLVTTGKAVGALGIGGGFLAACGGGSTASKGGASKTLVMGYTSIPSSLDPSQYTGTNAELTMDNVYATLMRYKQADLGSGYLEADYRNPTVMPWLASSLESSSDFKTFRLTLRDDVKSSAGNPLTAEDVRWTIARTAANPGNGQTIIKFANLLKASNVKVIDEHTLDLLPGTSTRLLPQLLANVFGFSIIDSVEAKKHATATDKWATKWLVRNGAGFGAYKVTKFTPTAMQFAVNPGYPIETPYYTSVRFIAVPEKSNQLSLLSTNSVQVLTELEPTQLASIKKLSGVKTYSTLAAGVGDTLIYNTKFPALKDPRVRQALTYAIPFQGLLDSVYRGTASLWQTPIGGDVYAGGVPSLNPYQAQDLAKAKQLLADAGATNLSFSIPYDNSTTWCEPVAIQLQSAWQSIGVKTTLEALPQSVWATRLGKGTMPIIMISLGWLVPDFMYVMDLLFNSASSINFSGWNTPQTDKILNAALTEQDPAKRNALARQFQEIFYRDIPEVIVAVRPTVTAMRDTVTGYTGQLNQMVYWPRLKPAG